MFFILYTVIKTFDSAVRVNSQHAFENYIIHDLYFVTKDDAAMLIELTAYLHDNKMCSHANCGDTPSCGFSVFESLHCSLI